MPRPVEVKKGNSSTHDDNVVTCLPAKPTS
jgi:hypothetical protein